MKLTQWLMRGAVCCLLLAGGSGCVTRTVTNDSGTCARGLRSHQPGEVTDHHTIWIWQHEFWNPEP